MRATEKETTTRQKIQKKDALKMGYECRSKVPTLLTHCLWDQRGETPRQSVTYSP